MLAGHAGGRFGKRRCFAHGPQGSLFEVCIACRLLDLREQQAAIGIDRERHDNVALAAKTAGFVGAETRAKTCVVGADLAGRRTGAAAGAFFLLISLSARSVAAETSLNPSARTLPVRTRSAIAPTLSSIGTCWSERCR